MYILQVETIQKSGAEVTVTNVTASVGVPAWSSPGLSSRETLVSALRDLVVLLQPRDLPRAHLQIQKKEAESE